MKNVIAQLQDHVRRMVLDICTLLPEKLNMSNLLKEELLFLVHNYYVIFLVGLLSIGITIFASSKAWRRTNNTKVNIPGRLGLPFLGETFSFLSANSSTKGCYDFVRLRRLWHGKWFKTRLFGKTHVFVPSAEGAKVIFGNDFGLFSKGYMKSMADALGSKSLPCIQQEYHKRIRRLLSDPFSMDSISKYIKQFDSMLCRKLKKSDNGKSFSVLDFSMQITFDAMCEMLMSVTNDSLLREIERDVNDISMAMVSFPVMIPGTVYYKGVKARKRLMRTFGEMIETRRSGKESFDDFLQSMLQIDSSPSDEKLDDLEIMDNLLTFMIAGLSTTAAAMMWSVKYLDENREVQDRIREEQLSIARKRPDGAPLTLEDLNDMSYGLKVFKETLRLANVALWIPRVALTDYTIEGYEIKKGWYANVDATCIHTDPDLYKDPMKFNPSRFDEMRKSYSFIPFGSGPRTCLGKNMARVIILVFLHRLTSGYTWTVDDLDSSLEEKSHIPRLKSGCPITLKSLKAGE